MSRSTSGSRSSVSGSTVVIGQRPRRESSPIDGVADVQFGAGPLEFGQPLDAADHDVRPEPAHVAPEGGHGAVCRDEQREHVEAFGAVVGLEPRVGAGSPPHRASASGCPTAARRCAAPRPRPACRGARAAGSGGAMCVRLRVRERGRCGRRECRPCQHGLRDRFAGQGLHRVAPERQHGHHLAWMRGGDAGVDPGSGDCPGAGLESRRPESLTVLLPTGGAELMRTAIWRRGPSARAAAAVRAAAVPSAPKSYEALHCQGFFVVGLVGANSHSSSPMPLVRCTCFAAKSTSALLATKSPQVPGHQHHRSGGKSRSLTSSPTCSPPRP